MSTIVSTWDTPPHAPLVDSRAWPPLNLDPWWDEPAYKAAQGTFSARGTFILNKLAQHDVAKLKDVLADLYRDEPPDPMDITKFQWHTVLAFMDASEAEIKDVQLTMGRVWQSGLVVPKRT